MTKNNVAIVDADSLLYYEMGKDTLEEAMAGIDQRIEDIMDKTNSNKLIGFLTLGKCFRYNYAKSKPYKYNRKGRSKPPIFYALREYVQQKYLFRAVKGLEADDCVAIAMDEWHKTLTFVEDAGEESYAIIICSPDKDVLKQIPGIHFNYQKSEFHETTDDQARDFLWKQVLMGDSTDGIPGIPGLGIKTADAIIDNMPSVLSHHQVVLSQYLAKFKLDVGLQRFYETFKLVRMHTDINVAAMDVPSILSVEDKFFEGHVAEKVEDLWE